MICKAAHKTLLRLVQNSGSGTFKWLSQNTRLSCKMTLKKSFRMVLFVAKRFFIVPVFVMVLCLRIKYSGIKVAAKG